MLLHETAGLRILQKIETARDSLAKPPQSPAVPRRRVGYSFAHGQFRACCASPEALGGYAAARC